MNIVNNNESKNYIYNFTNYIAEGLSSLATKIKDLFRWIFGLNQTPKIDIETLEPFAKTKSTALWSWCCEHKVAIGCAIGTLALLGAAYLYSQSQEIKTPIAPLNPQANPSVPAPLPARGISSATPTSNAASSTTFTHSPAETTRPSTLGSPSPTTSTPPPREPSQLAKWMNEKTTIEAGNPESPLVMFTSYNKESADRLDMSRSVAAVHRAYAEKYGIHQLTFERNLADGALPYWSKIAGLKAMVEAPEFRDKQWFAWLDDDMVITNDLISFDKLIDRVPADTHLLVTEDAMSQAWEAVPLNTGFILVRNSDESRRILRNLWDMRNTRLNDLGHTYANCPAQSCLHEQQALTDLNRATGGLAATIIPQRFLDGVGINTFSRFSHYDIHRQMYLNYDGDPEYSKWKPGDFMAQCTGLATWGASDKPNTFKFVTGNLRKACIDELIQNRITSPPEPINEGLFRSGTVTADPFKMPHISASGINTGRRLRFPSDGLNTGFNRLFSFFRGT